MAATYPEELAAIRATDEDLYGRLDWLVDEIGACWTRSRYRAIRAEHRGTLDQLASRYPAVHGTMERSLRAARRRSA